MPTIYIEGFKNKISEVNKSFLPKKKLKMFLLAMFFLTVFSNFGYL